MKKFKWAAYFIVCFMVAWIVIFTFSQEPFKQAVPAKILMYTTGPIPIYVYLLMSLVFGLTLGLVIAVYYYWILSVKLKKKTKEYKKLSNYTDIIKSRIPQDILDNLTTPGDESKNNSSQKKVRAKSDAALDADESNGETFEDILENDSSDGADEVEERDH